jgi:CheY-like chemotaxis protein
MGLAVVHGLVTGLGGAVDVQSTSGEGSRFTVYLPAVPPQQDEDAGEQEELLRGTGRVMLVDDEAPLVQMLGAMLASLGYEPLAFNSSEDALARLEGDPHCCDLLLSDMTMPGLSGQYLARRARELRPDLPVVLMTGYSQTLSPEDAFKQGVNAYLFKPITRQELARTLGTLLDTGQAKGKGPAGQA